MIKPHHGASKMTGAIVLSRALQSKGGDLLPEGARFILDLGIVEDDEGTQAKSGCSPEQEQRPITADEREELDSYAQADNMLSILQAQAILALKKAGQEP